mmetsp:Transcript_13165/g.27552  ORF Transcript_13165/g.27552 Transcript_13165/m.27552 type:complete len:215 (+) Transcript_13165:1306-1950(+)
MASVEVHRELRLCGVFAEVATFPGVLGAFPGRPLLQAGQELGIGEGPQLLGTLSGDLLLRAAPVVAVLALIHALVHDTLEELGKSLDVPEDTALKAFSVPLDVETVLLLFVLLEELALHLLHMLLDLQAQQAEGPREESVQHGTENARQDQGRDGRADPWLPGVVLKLLVYHIALLSQVRENTDEQHPGILHLGILRQLVDELLYEVTDLAIVD